MKLVVVIIDFVETGGNQSGGGRGGRSSVQFNIYGPYMMICTVSCYTGKDSTRPVGVFLPQDYGDNFMAPRYFGDRAVTRTHFVVVIDGIGTLME